ncbi:hypothetical protein [Streptomyces sp. NPDC058475]|uniref:hypothetical protein n=1 Tax=Streptomyces sp. NPDC058475 TaxID=3346518 RepID=UPI00364C4D25
MNTVCNSSALKRRPRPHATRARTHARAHAADQGLEHRLRNGLELGGAPRDPGNLWPEPHYGTKTASTKDGTETKPKNAVCNRTITLSAARSAIKNNWTTALQVTGVG